MTQNVSEFRNLILQIPNVAEGECQNKCFDGLKKKVSFEVKKSTVHCNVLMK